VPEEIPATYADTGERCVVTVRTLETRPPRRTFSVGTRPVFLLSPDLIDEGGRVIRADVPGAFGGF
jgi:hypothetical protein